MNFRSVTDLSKIISDNLTKVPRDVDLIVGIPRSGMLVANLLALKLNLKFCDVQSFLANQPLKHGRTRQVRFPEIAKPTDAKHVLVIDDSINTGDSLEQVKIQILSECSSQTKFTWAACFATPDSIGKVDIFFDIVPQLRFFEWNMMHHPFLDRCCVDIDGVLCVDPTAEENDDGEKYRHFLLNAAPLMLPSYPLGHLVTSRLEKYRAETETWLKNHGVIYNKLHMLDLPDAETRRRLRCHATFKAEVFRKEFATQLFIESEPHQSEEIAKLSGKHCFCYSTQKLYDPSMSYALVEYKMKKFTQRVLNKAKRIRKKFISRG